MPLLQCRSIAKLLRAAGAILVVLLLSATGRAVAQCASAGDCACDSSDCCTNSCTSDPDTGCCYCDLGSYGSSCGSDVDCLGGLVCINGQCGCSNVCDDLTCPGYSCSACGSNCNGTCQTDSDCPGGLLCMGGTCGCGNPCDDPSCSGYSCNSCGTNCNGTCQTDGDCSGGLVCIGGSCGCSSPCDDPSCSGYDPCECVGTCSDSSCSGYDVCTCVGTCASFSCSGYDPCTCE